MNGSRTTPLPLEPLLHAYVGAGLPAPVTLGSRAVAILSARQTFLAPTHLDRMSDGTFQEHLVRFYEACVHPALHSDRVVRKARIVRHAVTHLCHSAEPMPQKLERCLVADGAYFVAGLGPSFWSALVQALKPDVYPAWTRQTEAGLRRLGLCNADTPAGIYRALIEAASTMRQYVPSMSPLHGDAFLSLVSTMKGRRLFDGAVRTFETVLHEVRGEKSLRQRLRERGAELENLRERLEKALGARDDKQTVEVLSLVGPDSNRTLTNGLKTGLTISDWVRLLWESEEPLEILSQWWDHDAALWLPTAVLHLKDPQRFPLWNEESRAGYAQLDDSAEAGDLTDRYHLFCEGVDRLRRAYTVHPLEVGEVLSWWAGERETINEELSHRFGGFCADTFRFLRDLEEHNGKCWLDTQRGRYQFVLREPLAELCQALSERYVEPVLRREHDFALELEARDGLALTRLTKNAFGRSEPYNTTFWITFCARDSDGKRDPLQFFVRLDADGLRYGIALGARTATSRRQLRQRLLSQSEPLHSQLKRRGGFEGNSADFLRWLEGKELILQRHLASDDSLLHSDDLVGEILLFFDRLLPLYAAAMGTTNLTPVVTKRFDSTSFMRLTHLDEAWLKRATGLLQLKRQLILQGVPGTGKTHVARCLARLLTDDVEDAVCLVQFHPSYSYEEFVEGIRVQSIENNGRHDITYPVEDGVLCAFAARAAAHPSQPHVLILDEMNRANLPRVFGELLYLLEYRDQEVTLPCSKRRFRLPSNLYLIGTMNRADRSTATLDQALRRRFSFVEMTPDATILRAWLREEASAPDATEIVELFERVNGRLRQELGAECQVGHSYFMQPRLDESRLRAIWQHQIRPLLQDVLASHPGRKVPLEIEGYLEDRRVRQLV